MMEKEEKKNQIVFKPPPEAADLFLQWGNRKRLRRKITSRILTSATAFHKEISLLQPTRLTRNSEAAVLRSENRKSVSASPEKEDRYYATRGSVAVGIDENGKASVEGGGERVGGDEKNRGIVWPKLYITLSSKEKEEDFMAMKGCKPPQRPKKRAKIIQRTLLLVSPGAWLTDMCQERYEVREKKSSKKRPRGLKAMGSMESDSE